ncbi:MAG: wax synthase family protein [Bryobacteraceae bacterium]
MPIEVPAWVAMWTLAASLFVALKWTSWRRAAIPAAGWRAWGFLLAWPGMDARRFMLRRAPRPRVTEWIAAAGKTLLGVFLIWRALPAIPFAWPLAAGWTGMIGLVFVLHFGVFHLAALAWQSMGVAAEPLMRAPLLATSLADFWGRRWNLAFRALAHDLVFRPLARFGAPIATMTAFAASGLVHDVVLSIPARGGYGRPTLYFVLQGFAVLLSRRFGLDRGLGGRVFALTLVILPAPLLFHEPFVTGVILPFLAALGATPHGEYSWN